MFWVLIFLQKLLQTVYTGELQVGEHPVVNSFVFPCISQNLNVSP